MAGVTWRQHRFALAGVAVLLGAVAVCLWIVGTSLHHAYAAASACHPASSAACQGLVGALEGMDNFLSNGFILQVLPALIGAFVGAPVLARELETGTFRYAWTQGFGRWRWALAKLVLLAIAVTVAAGAFGALLSWYYQPYFAPVTQALGLYQMSPFFPGLFSLRGVGFPAWTLAAFAIGALAGMLIRRVVPAIVATLAAYTALAFAAGGLLREHYLTPLLTTNNFNLPGTAWVISQWSTKDGRFAFAGLPPMSLLNQFCSSLPRRASLRWERSSSASPSTATPSGPATSRPVGSGRSSGSRAAGCSRCRCCSSPRPSGWSATAPPDASRQARIREAPAPAGRPPPSGARPRQARPGGACPRQARAGGARPREAPAAAEGCQKVRMAISAGAASRPVISSSRRVRVIEQPAMSRDVQ